MDTGDDYGDYTYARDLLYWEPRVSLAAGLQMTVKYYRQHLFDYL
jgi:nucleoside-diphosphate-sugar epimerase